MLRAGMIRQSSAGIYSWLPLGFRVLKRVERIVREEMDAAGCLEVLMPTIQPAELWRESGRYDDYGPEMLRIKDRHEHEMLYGPTNEEQITEIFRDAVKSYRDGSRIPPQSATTLSVTFNQNTTSTQLADSLSVRHFQETPIGGNSNKR